MSNSESVKRYVPQPMVAKRYDVTTRTLNRWRNDPAMGFPQPITIRNRCFFLLEELEAFERSAVAARAHVTAEAA